MGLKPWRGFIQNLDFVLELKTFAEEPEREVRVRRDHFPVGKLESRFKAREHYEEVVWKALEFAPPENRQLADIAPHTSQSNLYSRPISRSQDSGQIEQISLR